MTYQETLNYLFSQLPMYQRVGKAAYKADLSTSLEFDRILDHPHKFFKSIHIAGTNGKGSTAHMLTSILMEAGYKTGLYTSPHLVDFRERIKVNGNMIDKQFVIDFVEKYQKATEKLAPSFFEWTVALAFEYFKSMNVDVAVIETGMGGRLDSTNIVKPEVSVITNIGFDHQQFLGDSLEKIAAEKAGIIKSGVPVVIGPGQEKLSSVFKTKASEHNSEIHFCKNSDQVYESDLQGVYQLSNIRTAIKTTEILRKKGWHIPENKVKTGLLSVFKNTGLLGRWQKLSSNPLTICDVGHNEDGIRLLKENLKRENFRKLHVVWGMVNDKEIDTILKLLPSDAKYYFCKAEIQRSLSPEILFERAVKVGLKGNKFEDVIRAYEAAKTAANENDMLLIGGSTFVVADLLTMLYD
jgi:dihydrofolate synthase/folylpolyglutamate synthase